MNLKKYNLEFYFRMSYKKFFLVSGLFICLLGCATALYVPTQQKATASGTTLDSLQQGRKVYVNSCGSCHTLFLPEQYTTPQWERYTNSMQKRAKIDNQQKALILKYLSAGSKQ